MLKDQDAMIDVFHDLKNLLAGIQLGLGVLRLKVAKEPELLLLVKNTESFIFRANALMRNLSDFGETKNNPMKLNVKDILKEIVDSYFVQAQQKQIKIQLDCFDIKVKADPIKLNRIFDNLISNALEHSRCSDLKITGNIWGSFCKITFSDNGSGFIEAACKNTGRGLGLRIVKNFVQMNGGDLKIESAENKGSSFELTIPLF